MKLLLCLCIRTSLSDAREAGSLPEMLWCHDGTILGFPLQIEEDIYSVSNYLPVNVFYRVGKLK